MSAMVSNEDRQIIARCLAGERESFEMIVQKYQSGVLALAWSVLRDKADAEDIAQETFFRAYMNLNKFDPSKSFKNWLYAIAFKRCLTGLENAKNERKSRLKIAEEAIRHDPRPEWERSVDDRSVLAPLLARLSSKERLALSLAVNEGCSSAEIAEVLHCAESTARVFVFNAKRKLRKMLTG
jgi:RNA polymerase sigma-70 factor (ECF subfamily)